MTALVFLLAPILVLVMLLGRSLSESFPADHGVTATDDQWVRCAAETIEAHPEAFGAPSGFVIEADQSGALQVRTALITTPVQFADGRLSYRRFDSWHTIPMDCPGVGLFG